MTEKSATKAKSKSQWSTSRFAQSLFNQVYRLSQIVTWMSLELDHPDLTLVFIACFYSNEYYQASYL